MSATVHLFPAARVVRMPDWHRLARDAMLIDMQAGRLSPAELLAFCLAPRLPEEPPPGPADPGGDGRAAQA